MDAEFLSSPLRTEVSRCVAGEESRSELANTPASWLTLLPSRGRVDRHRDCFVAALLAMTQRLTCLRMKNI